MPPSPRPIEPTRSFSVPRPDATLHAEWFAPASPRGVVVVTHGYAEHGGRYREVADTLVRAGAAVLTYDCRGHGRSSGQRGHVERFETYLDDLDSAIAWARGESAIHGLADPRIVLLGHSHGALITLRALADASRALDVVAAAVASPFLGLRLKVNPVRRAAGLAVARVWPSLTMASQIRIEDLTSDDGKLSERRGDTLCHDVMTPGWFVEATAAQEFVRARAGDIRVPTQWLVGGADPIADPSRAREVAERVRGAPVEYHDLRGLKHEVFNERSRGEVLALLTRFVGTALSVESRRTA
jgi:alpha-beta hydrolase superfamily lysophospholipase